MRRKFMRWAILTVLIALVGILPIYRSLTSTSRASFDEQTAHIVALEGAHTSEGCTLSDTALKREPAWLIDICADFGLAGYDAARRYPTIAPQVFKVYGGVAEFREVLNEYGHIVVPVIAYFVKNGSSELLVRETIGEWVRKFAKGEQIIIELAKITPEQYGLLGIFEIKSGGRSFLGQFTIVDTVAKRLELKRAFFTTENLLAGGLIQIEEIWKRGERLPTWGEIGEAALDATIVVGAGTKLLKLFKGASKAARAGKKLEELAVVSKGARALEIAKAIGKSVVSVAPVGFVIFAVVNPVWTTQYAGWIAEQFGFPWWTGAVAVWLVLGGILALCMPFLVPLFASICLWIALVLVRISLKASFKVSRFVTSKLAHQIRTYARTST